MNKINLEKQIEFIKDNLNELKSTYNLFHDYNDKISDFWNKYIKVTFLNTPAIIKKDIPSFDQIILEELSAIIISCYEDNENDDFVFEFKDCNLITKSKQFNKIYRPKKIDKEEIFLELLALRNKYVKRMAKIEGFFLFDLIKFTFKYMLFGVIIITIIYFSNENYKNKILLHPIMIEVQHRISDLKEDNLFMLHIITVPDDSTIKILNIKPKFVQGIRLKEGFYEIEISKNGFEPFTKTFLLNKNTVLDVKIKQKVEEQ